MNLKIEFVHDIDCSWCPINYANLKATLKGLNERITSTIEFLPYEVKPDFSQKGELIGPRLMAMNNWTEEQHDEYRVRLLQVAQDSGVKIDFSKRTHYYNTKKAHQLLHFASLFDKQTEMNELLIEGYFALGLNLTDTMQLVELANRAGLNNESAKKAIEAQEKPIELLEKYARAREISNHGVPAIRINNTKIIIGTKDSQYFERIIYDLI